MLEKAVGAVTKLALGYFPNLEELELSGDRAWEMKGLARTAPVPEERLTSLTIKGPNTFEESSRAREALVALLRLPHLRLIHISSLAFHLDKEMDQSTPPDCSDSTSQEFRRRRSLSSSPLRAVPSPPSTWSSVEWAA